MTPLLKTLILLIVGKKFMFIKNILVSRFYTTVLAGVIAGITNLTGLNGFVFYFIYFIIVGLIIHTSHSVASEKGTHFLSNSTYILNGCMGNIMVYLIFWVMFYNFVHIF